MKQTSYERMPTTSEKAHHEPQPEKKDLSLSQEMRKALTKAAHDTERILRKGEQAIDMTMKSDAFPQERIHAIQQELCLKERLQAIKIKILAALEEFRDTFRVKPIDRFEEFWPSLETKEILRTPSHERKKKLEEFKEKYAYQKKNIAQLSERVISEIRKNPDIPIQKLTDKISGAWGGKYRLNDGQRARFEEALKQYAELHRAVEDTRKKYPDDPALFNALFGRPPKGDVEIIKGPITFYVRAHHPDDYAYIVSQNFFTREEASEKDKEFARGTGGISISSSLIPELAGALIAENAQGKLFGDYEKNIYTHEEQHAIHRLFVLHLEPAPLAQLETCDDDTQRERILTRYLRGLRAHFEERIKDEILAYFKEKRLSREEIQATLLQPREEGGLYDYMSGMTEQFRVVWAESHNPNLQKAAVLLETMGNNILKEEYQHLVQSACYIYERALMWYPVEQAQAIFEHEPLRKWKKVDKRILAGEDIFFNKELQKQKKE